MYNNGVILSGVEGSRAITMKTIEQKAKKVPAIRFAGFDDEWVEKKLSELATMHARIGWQNLRTSEFLDDGDYVLVTGTDFEDGKISFSTCHYVAKERYDQDKNIQIHNGSILITEDGTLGKVAFVQNLTKPATLNAGVFNVELKNKKETDEKYLFQYLKAPFLMDYVGNKATGGTIKHLNQNILVDFPVISPKKEEQQKIGSFFSNIDSLISLEQKKYDKLTQVKKSMLEKMFPKEGATVPEIRFANFTGEWDEKKLCEIADRITRKNQNLESNLPLTISAQYGLIDQNEFFDKRIASKDISGYYLVKNGEFAYNKSTSAEAPWGAVKRLDRYEMGVLSTLYIVFGILENKQTDSNYLATYFNTNLWHKEVQLVAAEGARNHGLLNISADDFLQIDIMIPQNFKEQQKIGSYFSHLDSLISLQQRKLEKLKNIKKSLLEKMFV